MEILGKSEGVEKDQLASNTISDRDHIRPQMWDMKTERTGGGWDIRTEEKGVKSRSLPVVEGGRGMFWLISTLGMRYRTEKVRNLRLPGSHRDWQQRPGITTQQWLHLENGVELRQALRNAGAAPQKQR